MSDDSSGAPTRPNASRAKPKSRSSARASAPKPDQAAREAARRAIIANPEFVFDDAELMRALLEPSRPTTRKIVDLRSALVDRLERRLARLIEAHRDVIDAAWDNLSGMERAHQAALALIEAETLAQAGAIVLDRFPDIFEVDGARLCLEGAPQRDSDRLSDSLDIALLAPGFVSARVSSRPRVEGSVAFSPIEPTDRAIFDTQTDRMASVALIALDLGPEWPSGLLALGSTDAGRFGASQNADLLRFVGQTAERLLRRHLQSELGALPSTAAAPAE